MQVDQTTKLDDFVHNGPCATTAVLSDPSARPTPVYGRRVCISNTGEVSPCLFRRLYDRTPETALQRRVSPRAVLRNRVHRQVDLLVPDPVNLPRR